MDDKITLDRESFKVLAADTRVRILKILYKRRHMQAEIANKLAMSEPAIKEHLTAMKKVGLVSRKDEGRKWKYYELTHKGKAILDPEQKRIWIILSLFVLTAVGEVTSYLRTILAPLYGGSALKSTASEAAFADQIAASPAVALDASVKVTPAVESAGVPWGLILIGLWVAILLGLLLYSMYKRRKYLGKHLSNK